jgi:hypothetical protein
MSLTINSLGSIPIYNVVTTEIGYDDDKKDSFHSETCVFIDQDKAMNYAFELAKAYAIDKADYTVNDVKYYINEATKNISYFEDRYDVDYHTWSFQYMPYGQRKYTDIHDVINSLKNKSEIELLQKSDHYFWTHFHSYEDTENDYEYEIRVKKSTLNFNSKDGIILHY